MDTNDMMFGRFLVGTDMSVDRYIIRDADSRFNSRERIAVEEWIHSNKPIHVMRDHMDHCKNGVINGGMWGAKKGAIPNLKEKLLAWSEKTKYEQDMVFLASLWPDLKSQAYQHDR
jgi:hypothetical protein